MDFCTKEKKLFLTLLPFSLSQGDSKTILESILGIVLAASFSYV